MQKKGNKKSNRNSTKLFLFAILSVQIAVLVSNGISKALLCEKGDSAKMTGETDTAHVISPFQEDEDLSGIVPRAFPTWLHPFPCFEPDDHWYISQVQRSPAHTGLLYAKEMKTGSSTLSGVNIRIAKGVARRTNADFPICKSRFDHSAATTLDYANRIRDKSFLWTVLRQPAKRATSQFFHFQVSREKQEPSDTNFQTYLKEIVFQNYYLQSLAMTPFRPKKKDNDPIEFAKQILLDYDFIGITERMDESLVVLSMLLEGVELTDLLYLNAKGSGGYDDGRARWKCYYIIPAYISPTMKQFFESPKWKDQVVGDDLLYKAAWKSLDLTIDQLGRAAVEDKLEQFRAMKEVAGKSCAQTVLFPCGEDGQRTKQKTECLWNDSGCGNECLDKVAELLNQENESVS